MKFWTTVILIIIVALGGLFLLSDPGEDIIARDVLLQEPVSIDDISKGGGIDAPVTLVEYGDFQCPACKEFNSVIKAISAEFGDDLRIIFRHFPLQSIHVLAQSSAQAAQAAHIQGKFFEMHDILYDRQLDWSKLTISEAKDKFIEYAIELGLDKIKFTADMESEEVANAILSDIAGGQLAGLTGTPSVFVDGKLVTNNPEILREAIINVLVPPPLVESIDVDAIVETK